MKRIKMKKPRREHKETMQLTREDLDTIARRNGRSRNELEMLLLLYEAKGEVGRVMYKVVAE